MPDLSHAITQLLQRLRSFPWRTTVLTLRTRFREDQLGLTASSLTFTTTMALVPFFTVALAVFTAFPMFGALQNSLQHWLVESLVPPSIANPVLGYLTQFAAKASRLGLVGLSVLLVTALALVLTIDRTLNNIWRVKRPRPLAQRVLIYWAVLTLGPLLLAASLAMTSYVLSASRGLVGAPGGGLRLVLGALEFVLLSAGMSALYHYVPNAHVRWAHATAGGVFAAISLELGKKLLGLYLAQVPTYSAVYGAFATVPILLVWMYVAWVIALLGAVVAAYLPSLLAGVARRGGTPGWEFTLALETLAQLAQPQHSHGLSAEALAEASRVDPVQLESALEALTRLDWIGRLEDNLSEHGGRYVLLIEPSTTPLAPLVSKLLLVASPQTAFMHEKGLQSTSTVRDAL